MIILNAYEARRERNFNYNFRKINEENFSEEILAVDWSFLNGNDLDVAYENFISVLSDVIDKTVPRFNQKKKANASWSNRNIQKIAKRKRQQWDRYRYSNSENDYETYKNSLRLLNDAKNDAIVHFENNIICNKNTNKKKYYRYVSNKNQYKNQNIVLNDDENNVHSDENQCATILNKYFSSVFTVGPSDFNIDFSNVTVYPEMCDFEISENEIKTEINALDVSKAAGPDGIPGFLLKKLDYVFVPILTKIFQRSYNEGIVPNGMKRANVKPLFKSGEKTSPANYRPVSLTPIITKIFEKMIKKRIEEHVERYKILSPFQHGFRKSRSTATNLIQFTNDLANMANNSKSIAIIYTDMRKAFDSVPHDLLIFKLRRYGITGLTIKWVTEFLSDRQHRVCIGDAQSSYASVQSGVPQGAVLSGILFALYINDLPELMRHCHISLYADDAKLYYEITSEDSIEQMQQDINRLHRWCNEWRLMLHPQKCHHVQYSPRSANRSFEPKFFINGTLISRKQKVKDLGIIISEDLKCHAQVNEVCKKAHLEISRIRRSFHSRSPKFITDMFKLYVSYLFIGDK